MKLNAGGPQHILDMQTRLEARPYDLDIRRLKRSAQRIRHKQSLDRCLPKKKR